MIGVICFARRPYLRAVAVLAGLCALAALAASAATAAASVPAWTTYRHDAARTGIDPDSTSPVPPHGIWRSAALDGRVSAEPLVYGSRVYVATENDSVYALNAATGAIIWRTHVATPVPQNRILCSAIYPIVGIVSTPVIDPADGRIYVVGDTWDGTDESSIAHEMFGLNLSDGSVAVGPVDVDAPGSTPYKQLQRPGLALDAGNVFVGYGSNSDCGKYHGYLVGVPENGGPLDVWEADAAAGENGGSIWAGGNAPPVDSAGDLWISTANGTSTTWDYQEAVIKFDPNNLNPPLDVWAPSYWAKLDAGDYDMGSGAPLLLPDGLVFEIGKLGVGYLLNASNLGGLGGQPVYQQRVCNSIAAGGAIYYNNVIYVSCGGGMYALALNTANSTFSPLPGWQVDPNAIGPPIEAGGLIWSVDYNNGVMDGINPSTGSASFSVTDPSLFEHFATPSAGGGRLFVAGGYPGGTDEILAFQIANAPAPSSTSSTLSSSSNPASAGQVVTFTASVSPAPDAGTVSFTDNGATIPGCQAQPVAVSTGQATCTTSFSTPGSYPILATYSGDAYYTGSSGSLSQSVTSTSSTSSSARIHPIDR